MTEEILNEEEALKKITKVLTLSKTGFQDIFEEIIPLESTENSNETKNQEEESEKKGPDIKIEENLENNDEKILNLSKVSPRKDLDQKLIVETEDELSPISPRENEDELFEHIQKTRPRAKRTVIVKKEFNMSFTSLNDPLGLRKKRTSKSIILSSSPLLSLHFEIVGNRIALGTTEPSYSKKFRKEICVNYSFYDVQEILIELRDYDNKKTYGEGTFILGSLVKKSLSHEIDLYLDNEPTANILIKASHKNPYMIDEKSKKEIELYADFDISATIKYKGDYSLQVYIESNDVSFALFHKSEVVKKTKEPIWNTFSFELNKKIATDKKFLKIELLQDDKIIGKSIGTYSSWKSCKSIEILNSDKLTIGYMATSIRQREVIVQQMNYKYSFIDYINFGTKFTLSFAIDFSTDNDIPKQYTNLHEIRNGEYNHYEQIIYSFIDILSQYNPTIKMYSFAHKTNKGEQFSCISDDITDVKKTYREFVKTTEFGTNLRKDSIHCLYGGNDFNPILEYFLNKHVGEHFNYHILVILVPNDSVNLPKLLKNFIACSNQIPISIIIIGIGNLSFRTLKSINPNPKEKVEKSVQYFFREPMPYQCGLKQNGIRACREVFQFKTFNSISKNYKEEVKNMMSRIPVQMVKYMISKGIEPK